MGIRKVSLHLALVIVITALFIHLYLTGCMQQKAVRYLVYAQVSFFLCLLIDVFISTAGFKDNHGLSFYGDHFPSIVFFGIGLIACDYFLLKAAISLPINGQPFTWLRPSLRLIAILLLLILLTPDALGEIFYYIHVAAAASLFLFELIIATLLALRWNGDKLTWFLLVVQLGAGIVAMLSQLHLTHYLSQSSLVFQLVFALLLIWSISQLISHIKIHSIETK